VELLAKGLRYKEIADRLFLSTETVRTHIRNIYQKLQVNSRTEALNKVYGK
jgi:DNA-binding NarL/FixJ family response regulator